MSATGTVLRLGVAGCGQAARAHLDRLLRLATVEVVGCADPDPAAADALAALVAERTGRPAGSFRDHAELLRSLGPDALAVFSPHVAHYRAAMDALQAGCHVFVEKPLSTNVQEAADVVGLARARGRLVAVGHQYRLCPSLAEARSRLAAGAIGRLRLVTAVLAQPWLAAREGPEHSWRFDPKVSGGGILADSGDHLLDTLLWTTGQAAAEAAAVQDRLDSGLDVVTAAAVRLADGTPATLAVSGVSPGAAFELTYYGEAGRLRATDQTLEQETGLGPPVAAELPRPRDSIDANFVAAVLSGGPLCCPADEALATVRLLDAVARSARTGQAVRLD